MLQTFIPNVLSDFSDVRYKCVYLDVTYVVNILSGCCISVALVFKCFMCFFQVFQMHVSNVSSVFIRMLQVLYLDVSKVDRVLHLSPRLLLSRFGVSSS
jgi:hypothetical protein